LGLFTFVDLFCGIGGFHQAAAALGGECVLACDVDAAARKAYAANYGTEPHGDIRNLDAAAVPDHDALFAGFPCQPFSVMGNRLGFDDHRGTLFIEVARILAAKLPPLVVLENVKQLRGHRGGRTLGSILGVLGGLGYRAHCEVLNALDFGLPQKRERLIIVAFLGGGWGFRFPRPVGRGSRADILEDVGSVDPQHFASDAIRRKRLGAHRSPYSPGIWHENKSGHVSSHPYSCALRAGASYNYLLVNGVRRLTPREMLRLQGFPDSFADVCGDSQTRKQAGNAVPVNMIRDVLAEALRALGQAQAAG
jgi:DNA (cytosine-5)-methyltransferase 1